MTRSTQLVLWRVVGYIVDSDHRTSNMLRLLPWVVGGAVVTAVGVATTVVVVLGSPEAAAVIAGLSTASAGGVVVRACWQRRSTRTSPKRRGAEAGRHVTGAEAPRRVHDPLAFRARRRG